MLHCVHQVVANCITELKGSLSGLKIGGHQDYMQCLNGACVKMVDVQNASVSVQYRTVLLWSQLGLLWHPESQMEVNIFHSHKVVVMSLSLNPYVLLLPCHMAQRAAWDLERNESIKYQKFEVCSVDISRDLNNVILIRGKHLVTSIVVLSSEKQAPCHWHTYASRTYKVVRPKITAWQSTPFIHS